VYTATIVGAELYVILWFFFIYSVLGVLVEMIFCLAKEGVLESRVGLLYLPLSPLYGVGGVVLTLFLLPYIHQPGLMFLAGMLVGTVLEYLASLIMEKLFKSVFWDYSKRPLNLQGRVCLQYSIYWGLLSMLLLYVLDAWAYGVVRAIPRSTGDAVLTVLVVLTVASIVLTLLSFRRLSTKVERLEAGRPVGSSTLLDRLVPDKVMINTYPRMGLVQRYMALTGLERAWVTVPRFEPDRTHHIRKLPLPPTEE
jgi:uncharacterized membrane protein